VPVDPPLAHLLGVPFEELLPSVVGLGAVLAYVRLWIPWRRSSRGPSSSAR
jgi:hypothetical protein